MTKTDFVKIVKDITEILKDKQKDVIDEEDKTDNEEGSDYEGTKDDNKEGRLSIDLKHLLVDNNEVNISKKESKEMIHRSKNLKK